MAYRSLKESNYMENTFSIKQKYQRTLHVVKWSKRTSIILNLVSLTTCVLKGKVKRHVLWMLVAQLRSKNKSCAAKWQCWDEFVCLLDKIKKKYYHLERVRCSLDRSKTIKNRLRWCLDNPKNTCTSILLKQYPLVFSKGLEA